MTSTPPSETLPLYLDEDCQRRTFAAALLRAGFDVVTSHAAGMDGTSDVAQLEFASSQQRILVTSNIADFCRLHSEFVAQNSHHHGIILVPQQRWSLGEQVQRLQSLAQSRSRHDMQNRLEFLSGWPPMT